MRRRGKIDTNHNEIAEAFRKAGYRVQSLASLGGGVPDLLIQNTQTGFLHLIEVKHKNGALTADQEQFIAEGWRVTVVRSVEDVMALTRRV